MSVVRLFMSMSLDGFVATRGRDNGPLYPDLEAKHDPAKGLTFTFVTDGVESAVRQAKSAAGEKDVQVTVVGEMAGKCHVVSRRIKRRATRSGAASDFRGDRGFGSRRQAAQPHDADLGPRNGQKRGRFGELRVDDERE